MLGVRGGAAAAPVPVPVPAPVPVRAPLAKQMTDFFKKWPAAGYKKMKPNNPLGIYDVPGASKNKQRIVKICEKLKLPLDFQLLTIAKGMIESQALAVSERDITKDPGGKNWCGEGCINFSFANLNTSLIRDVLKERPDLASIGMTEATINASDCGDGSVATSTCDPAKSILNQDTDEGFELAIRVVVAGIEIWGLDKYIDYLRGGATLFKDTKDYSTDEFITSQGDKSSYLVAHFKCGLTWICDEIKKDIKLLTDDRRCSLHIQHV